MARKPRRFGRARTATLKRKAVDFALGVLYAGGWPAVVTRAVGLQGTLQVSEHRFEIRRAKANAPDIRVAFASDLHAGPTLHRKLEASVLTALADARADLLLLGGDFVSFHARYINGIIGRLKDLPAPLSAGPTIPTSGCARPTSSRAVSVLGSTWRS